MGTEMNMVKNPDEYICLVVGIFFFPKFETDST